MNLKKNRLLQSDIDRCDTPRPPGYWAGTPGHGFTVLVIIWAIAGAISWWCIVTGRF